MKRSTAYVGTYTRLMDHVHGEGEGIYTVEVNHSNGALRHLAAPTEASNSSYLCQNASATRLYAISEVTDYKGNQDGCLRVFDISNTQPKQIQELSSAGMGPAYISIDQSGRWLFCANYVQGNLVVFPIQPSGTVGDATQNIKLSGSGPNRDRQDAPHPHAILARPDNRFVYAVDLGTDRISGYHFDSSSGFLEHKNDLDLYVGAGSGPRHFIFHPNGSYAYVVQELTSEVGVCSFDPSSGQLALLQAQSTLPSEFDGISHCSELRITRDGHHLYVANRGHDTIAVFEVQPNGTLRTQSHVSCLGHIPRNICLSPDDRYLLVANQETNQIVSLRRDVSTGSLHPTSHILEIPTPAYIEFAQRP